MERGSVSMTEYARNTFGERLETVGTIVLNLDFWDCGCDNGYIHPVDRRECTFCGWTQENGPSSREEEVERFLGRLTNYRVTER